MDSLAYQALQRLESIDVHILEGHTSMDLDNMYENILQSYEYHPIHNDGVTVDSCYRLIFNDCSSLTWSDNKSCWLLDSNFDVARYLQEIQDREKIGE